jgi:hypothetical protein
VVFLVVVPLNLVVGNQRFGGRPASFFRVQVREQEEVSTALLPIHSGYRRVMRGFRVGEAQAPNYTAQHPRKPRLLFLSRENLELRINDVYTFLILYRYFVLRDVFNRLYNLQFGLHMKWGL